MKIDKNGKIVRLALGTVLLAILSLIGTGCHLYNLEKQLKPPDAQFLDQVRYIITPAERKTFLEIPDAGKSKFIEDFWKRRDPDPDTEVNEFKVEYFGRIDKANELFRGEGRPGWLTDRGRIYILFGPPMDRIVNPPSLTGQERCSEVWYYGQFPVVFTDANCTGNYDLVTYDLTPMRDQNLAYMSTLNQAQDNAQKTIQSELMPPNKPFFGFDCQVEKTAVSPDRVEGRVLVDVPLARIWFTAVQDRLETTLEINVSLKDSKGNVYWEKKESVPVSTTEDKLKSASKETVHKVIGFLFDRDLDRLRAGKNEFLIEVKNATGSESSRKTVDFTL